MAGRWGWRLVAVFGRPTFLLLLASLAGCATIRGDYVAQPSQAFDRPQETALGRAYAAGQAERPGLSAFRLINNGVSALLTRAALADLAERSLDIQYYIYDPDETGAFLLERIQAAAERGVRVRIILDDYLLGLDDASLARIDAHPNVEVRIFNPYRDRMRWSRPLQMLFNLDRLGRRMHNKVFVADGQIGILGGRNISNHYMEGEAEANFRDVDLLASGPVVGEALRSFDAFWNSEIVVPVAAFEARPADNDDALHFDRLRAEAAAGRGPYAEYGQRKPDFVRRLLAGEGMIWARGRAIAEPPVRQREGEAKPSAEIARALAIARQNARKEVTYAVAYFVPGERGVQLLSELAGRGVRVRVLTNSLAATDVVAVHAGYSKYREGLLAGGVELYEYRSDARRPEPGGHRLRLGSSGSALHAKVVVHDRRLVWVGSANFDPRSRRLNTEAGLLIESEELAERLLSSIEWDFSPRNSWQLGLEKDPQGGSRRLTWNGERDGKIVNLAQEPDAGLLRHLGVLFYSILPGVEDLL
ncbi:MAG: phospholipase D family protein [Rhodocyclaceae bacterium]|nr:phospholipase D family protein [Rhodocyclaceae bacterium]